MELNTCILRQDPIHITFVPAINPHYLLLVLNSRCRKLLGCYPFGSSAMHTQTTSPSGIDYALALHGSNRSRRECCGLKSLSASCVIPWHMQCT